MTEAEASPIPSAEPAPAEPPLTDWTLRPFAATRHAPLWVGLAVVVGMTGLSQLLRLAFGSTAASPFYADPFFWLDVLNAVLLAYIPAALVYLRRGRLQDLRALRPVLGCSDREFARRVEEVLCVAPRPSSTRFMACTAASSPPSARRSPPSRLACARARKSCSPASRPRTHASPT